jgi:hypothetical protein
MAGGTNRPWKAGQHTHGRVCARLGRVATPRLVLLALIVIPALVYTPSVLHEYGMRDDYSHLREAHEQPGKLQHFHGSLGRPLYGLMMERSFAQMPDVAALRYARLGSLTLLIGLGLLVLGQLRALGWAEREAAAVALGITLLPAAQMMVSWAAQWGFALALWLSVAGFAAAERGLARHGPMRGVLLAIALIMYVLAALTYQSHTGFAMLLVGAGLCAAPRRAGWVAAHVGTFFGALLVAFGLMRAALLTGLVPASSRTVLEHAPLGKLGWFVAQPLPDALALFVLRDDAHPHALRFWLAVALAVGLLGAALVVVLRERPRRWFERGACLVALPFVTYVVSLVAAEPSTAYRTQYGLAGLVLVLVIAAFARLRIWPLIPTLLLAGAAITAGHNAFALIAEPQGREWTRMKSAVAHAHFEAATRVYVIEPTQAHRLSELIHYDEFGSLTSASDWAPKEMFLQALRVRFPEGLPGGHEVSYAQGREPPAPGRFDVVIDMRMGPERS